MLGNPLLSIRHLPKEEVDALENQDTTALIVALLAGALGAFIVSWCLRWPKRRNGVEGNFVFVFFGGGGLGEVLVKRAVFFRGWFLVGWCFCWLVWQNNFWENRR